MNNIKNAQKLSSKSLAV